MDIKNLKIRDLAYEYINKEQLYDFVSDIIFKKMVFSRLSGFYNYNDCSIVLKKTNNSKDLLLTLFHEMTHAEQYKIIKTGTNNFLRELYVSTIELENISDYLYNRLYSFLPNEHHANSKSYIIVCDVLEFSETEKIKDIINSLLLNYKCGNNMIISPIEHLYKYSKYDINYINNLINNISNLYKLMHGLPIDIKLYKELDSIRKENTMNNCKELINYLK